jgi:hypothetical protein
MFTSPKSASPFRTVSGSPKDAPQHRLQLPARQRCLHGIYQQPQFGA